MIVLLPVARIAPRSSTEKFSAVAGVRNGVKLEKNEAIEETSIAGLLLGWLLFEHKILSRKTPHYNPVHVKGWGCLKSSLYK